MNTFTAIYCRVSKDEQEPEHQERELREYCARRRWEHVRVFNDVISGPTDSRSALDQMLCDARKGIVDNVVAVKLDRLGRSLIHLAHLFAEFDRMHIPIICTSQGIDTSNDNQPADFSARF
ncbi:MAG TPA: recombinase family protein [Opitutaceae bacterium]